ncbi:MAG: MBL fold metallo-hydrolase [Kiritimatiellae bacterium]|nr:MBL fold metallo-hydrolase [Kiritimatiellia bacterium]
MLNIRFLGAARTTTGSMHCIEFDGHRVLLDCGLLQGHRKEAFEANRALPFPADSIDAIILSHAHIDHSGRIPAFVKAGYRGPIWSTSATRDLCDAMLRDSAYLQAKDVEYVNKKRREQRKTPFELLYDIPDVERAMALFRTFEYGETREIVPGLKATFHDAGHILGSATVALDYLKWGKPRRLLFTGDLGQSGEKPFLRPPEPVEGVDALITESTYGDRDHPADENIRGRLRDYVQFIVQHRSKLVVPAFSVGRTQQMLRFLDELRASGKIPQIPVYVDSPLAAKATEIHRKHPECFRDGVRSILASGGDPFDFPGLHFVGPVQESMTLNSKPGPMVILSASGMCEGGRILHHLKNTIPDPLNLVLFTGFQAEGTLGRRIVDGAPEVKIYGEMYPLRATVFTINGLSAHADRSGLVAFAKSLGPSVRRAFCVHGEEKYCEAHRQNLLAAGIKRVDIPEKGQLFEDV